VITAIYTIAVGKRIDHAFIHKSNQGRKSSDMMSDVAKQIKSDITNSKGNNNDLYR